ncbi:DUF7210 family protein [Marinobacter xestospongiae]|uniref:DUF7210 family protein n=1 Tax=Marinobacter xestospongiae TaxID=994319 RepID=UPI00200349ED|nr:hypothetical protein [Marinobacter xestospongiae]MCK7568812.1 hypothetical protein [Marinobacter xestospongiae]
MTKTAETKPDLVSVTLKKPHRHNGKDYREGERVEGLTKAQLERLRVRGVV